MDITTLLGLALGLVLLVGSIMIDGSLGQFWSLQSLLIVFGGTFGALFVNFPLKDVLKIGSVLKIVFGERDYDPDEIISALVSFAEVSRREGLLALEERAQDIDEHFLQKGIQLVVDGTDPELVRSILEIDLTYMDQRHEKYQQMFTQLGTYAPAFGMIGTLIGLILMLRELDDPNAIGSGMAVALITTLYGAIFANLIFLPIAGKLKVKSAKELLLKEIMIEGILSIRAGENPRIVEEKLHAFLPEYNKLNGIESEEEVGERVESRA